MTNQQIIEEDERHVSADVSAEGAAAFSNLRGHIHRSLFDLRAGFSAHDEGTEPVERDVKSHLAEITKLLEAGYGENSENVLPANPGNTLDLEAAREEINRRLTKLTDQRGN